MHSTVSQSKETGSSTGGHRSVSCSNVLGHLITWYETCNEEKQSS